MVRYTPAIVASKIFSPSSFLRLFKLLSFILPFVLYASLLKLPIPDVSVWGEYINLAAVIILSPALLWAYRRSNWSGMFLSLCLTLGLFAVPLALLWSSAVHNYSTVGGLLPWSDAGKYYMEARRLLNGFLFTDWGGRRPLFHGMFAVFLGLTGQNLQWTIAILGAVNATSCYLVTREIQRTHGTLGAIIVLALLYLFSCTYVMGLALSESLGLSMGGIAFAMIWRGAWSEQRKMTWLGLLLLTLALCARAGAYLVLPLLIMSGGWYYWRQNRPLRHFFLIALGAVVLGFLINAGISNFIVTPGAVSNSNFSSTFYGLAVGGKGWQQVEVDHPGVNADDIYKLAFQIILNHPSDFLIGLIKGWLYYFAQGFDFISGIPVALKQLPLWKLVALMIGQGVLWLFSALGFVVCWRHRASSQGYLLLGAAALGILVSAPLLAMDGGTRVFAATIPFSVALVAVGSQIVLKRIKVVAGLNVPVDSTSNIATLSFGYMLALLVILGPLIILAYSKPLTFIETPCPPGQVAIFVRLTAGSSINLVANNAMHNAQLPNIGLSDFRDSDPAPGGLEFTNYLISLRDENTLFSGLNLKTGRSIWLVIPTPMMPRAPGNVAVCAVLIMDESHLLYRVFSISTALVQD